MIGDFLMQTIYFRILLIFTRKENMFSSNQPISHLTILLNGNLTNNDSVQDIHDFIINPLTVL